MRGHEDDTLTLQVTDGGILRDLDTQADYLAELERQNRRTAAGYNERSE